MNIPATQNEGYGFYGTIALYHNPQEFWTLAVTEICRVTGEHEEDVAVFLDSRHGRHFADEVYNVLGGGLDNRAAVAAAVDKWNAWTFGRRLSGETGLPQNTPYLHDLIAVTAARKKSSAAAAFTLIVADDQLAAGLLRFVAAD
ncbi:hypothetical protein [Neisseria musculi]|uniref:Uncharacterized protein n=1 Tax=Neisseria musculi TaxID=1815583 RepID=A0A7H1MAQ7_9NEIS|nr:hypothetical protein [Neisseria musculi]QNT58722.1 hypothetical protein H7A79_0801 [Neisseria musculi]